LVSPDIFQMKYWYLSQGSELIAESYAISDYVFTFLKSALSIAIIALIGSGWYFIKPFLSDRDKKILGIVVPLQVTGPLRALRVLAQGRMESLMSLFVLFFRLLQIFTSIAQVVAEETAFGSEAGLFFVGVLRIMHLLGHF
jgi:hypothetical protein